MGGFGNLLITRTIMQKNNIIYKIDGDINGGIIIYFYFFI